MSSLRSTTLVVAVSAAAVLIGIGCAPGIVGDDLEIGVADGVTSEAPSPGESRAQLEERATPENQSLLVEQASRERLGESQARQGHGYGGGGGGFGECYGLENGTYCGGNRVSGDPNALYECVNGNKYFRQYCGYGPVYGGGYHGGYGGGGGGGGGTCVWMPPGVPDYCA